jgi:hypothetical protein
LFFVTTDECTAAYDQLRLMLENQRLAWVARDLEAVVAIGKTEIKEVSTVTVEEAREMLAIGRPGALSSLPATSYPRRRGRHATFVATLDYTPEERLQLLIHAIRAAVKDTAEMEVAVADELVRGGATSGEIERSDGLDAWTVTDRSAYARASHARSLDSALLSLEAEI